MRPQEGGRGLRGLRTSPTIAIGRLGACDRFPATLSRCRTGQNRCVRVGVAHHFGWAVAVAASIDDEVVDRRRVELIAPGLPSAPIHQCGGAHQLHEPAEPLDDDALTALVTEVRASVTRATAAALDELSAALPEPIGSMSVRAWPTAFPTDIAVQRRVPYESRADSVMYCQVLAAVARARGWKVHLYDAKSVEAEAAAVLGRRADDVLHGPRMRLGPPWSKDHRIALAATIVARSSGESSIGLGGAEAADARA